MIMAVTPDTQLTTGQNHAHNKEGQACKTLILSWMLDPKVLLGGVWVVILAIAGGAVLVTVRGRIRVLQFTVEHDIRPSSREFSPTVNSSFRAERMK